MHIVYLSLHIYTWYIHMIYDLFILPTYFCIFLFITNVYIIQSALHIMQPRKFRPAPRWVRPVVIPGTPCTMTPRAAADQESLVTVNSPFKVSAEVLIAASYLCLVLLFMNWCSRLVFRSCHGLSLLVMACHGLSWHVICPRFPQLFARHDMPPSYVLESNQVSWNHLNPRAPMCLGIPNARHLSGNIAGKFSIRLHGVT